MHRKQPLTWGSREKVGGGGGRFQRIGELIYFASEAKGILVTPFVGTYQKYFQKIYIFCSR